MKVRNKDYRIILIATILLCFGCSVIFLTYSYFDGQWRFFYDAEIKNFSVCDANQKPYKGNMIKASSIEEPKLLYVCGILETSVPTSLTLLLHKEIDNEFIYIYDEVYREVEQGNFSLELLLPEKKTTGKYKVTIQFMRKVIATTEFTVIDQ